MASPTNNRRKKPESEFVATITTPAQPKAGLRILHVASEAAPFIKSGGLADVTEALPAALRRLGHDARLAIPCYRRSYLEAERRGARWLPQTLTIESGGVDHRVGIGEVIIDGQPVYLLACNELYDRDGIYGPSPHHTYEDNARRFSVLSKAALALPGAIDWMPHIVHAHDWQTGLVPVLLQRGFHRALPATRSVFTVHNIAYQGAFPAHDMRLAGLDPWLYNPMHCEHFGLFNMLKCGMVFADRVTTVSKRYAEEIQTTEYGAGLEAVVRHHAYKLSGITNGIDERQWNPATDPHLSAHFSREQLAGKSRCREDVLRHCGLVQADGACLITIVSRLAEQKGIDLVLDAVSPYIIAGRMQLVVIGSGDLALEQRLHALQNRHPGWVYAWYGYNEELAHRCIAGADAFMIPSRFEPCGLTQMYAMRYGTLPIARFTGGLADTVRDVSTGHGTGFTFGPIDVGHFSAVLDRALGLFEHFPDTWREAQLTAMAQDFSWDRAAIAYADLYQSLTFA